MDIAAEKLEALVNQAEVTLDNILFDLESSFSKRAGVQFKPALITAGIEESEQEFAEVEKIANAYTQKYKEVEKNFKELLDVVCKKVLVLQNKSECSGSTGAILSSHLATLEL